MTLRHLGLSWQDCRSLHVVARFARRQRVALDSDWPLLLDGLLAGVGQRRRPGAKPTETVSLPLARYTRDAGSQWSWLASVGSPLGHESPEWAYRWQGEPATIAVECAGLEWHAVGDAAGVRDLLGGVTSLGNRRHEAGVMRWDVIDSGKPPDEQTCSVWLPSGYIARPIAARAAGALGVPGAESADGAIRPPYWRPPPGTADGSFTRAWRPVIAPWTIRPAEERPP